MQTMINSTTPFQFVGRHYMASIYQTNVSNGKHIRDMLEICLQQGGAHIVGYTEHVFENNAITFCFLLRESHCTVHTYPEYESMWIDVFTCGTMFDFDLFETYLQSSLQIGHIQSTILSRQ
jgi:S-adenosylmethionine decarboxylase